MTLALLEKRGDLIIHLDSRLHRQMQVLSVKAADKSVFRRNAERLRDVFLNARRRGRRQRDADRVWKRTPNRPKLAVFRAEVMPPLRNAVRLIDGDTGDVRFFQQRQDTVLDESFRRDVKQLDLPCADASNDVHPFSSAEGAVVKGGGDFALLQRPRLVLHERDERRHNDRQSVKHKRGELVAERFAAAGGENNERASPGENMVNDFALHGAKLRMSKDVLKQTLRVWRSPNFIHALYCTRERGLAQAGILTLPLKLGQRWM